MGQYNSKGMYAGYDKNNKEREAKDYYSTPTKEVTNILQKLKEDKWLDEEVTNLPWIILEPCAGGGHMVKGIEDFSSDWQIIATDIQNRGQECKTKILSGEKYDFLSDEYPCIDNIDLIIMNPPYSVIEPFVMKSLDIAHKGVLMLARLQFLEGQKRYNKILKDNPPTAIYVYVDRISCFKNGNVNEKMASAQAYAWFYWDKRQENNSNSSKLHWIRRV